MSTPFFSPRNPKLSFAESIQNRRQSVRRLIQCNIVKSMWAVSGTTFIRDTGGLLGPVGLFSPMVALVLFLQIGWVRVSTAATGPIRIASDYPHSFQYHSG